MNHFRNCSWPLQWLSIGIPEADDKIFNGPVTEGILPAQESLNLAEEYMAIRWQGIAHILLGFGYINVGSFERSSKRLSAHKILATNFYPFILCLA